MWTLTDGECGNVGVLLKSRASVSMVVVGAYLDANVRLCRASLADGYGFKGSVVRNKSSLPKIEKYFWQKRNTFFGLKKAR